MYKITKKEKNTKKISDILAGNFIELGYGIQVEGLWSEMLFNRSFEDFLPYKGINKAWYDLYYDEDDQQKYEKDWRVFDWYHSIYEHNAWFAAPNDLESHLIEDESTFIIEKSPYTQATIALVKGGIHGEYCMRISNPTKDLGGLAQRGKVLENGKIYNFSGYFKNLSTQEARVTVALMKEGDFINRIDSFDILLKDKEFAKYSYEFKSNYSGRAMLLVWIQEAAIEVDCFSLMPKDNYMGFRNEVIEKAREIKPKVIRWPGGCFASFYDWTCAIGPFEKRKPSKSFFWGGYNYNDVGPMELANFCEALGAKQMICVNLYHPKKEYYDIYFNENEKAMHGQHFPQFTDLYEGAKSAANWVAYMNADSSHPMGSLRKEHGREEAFNVSYWEIDNEPLRWFDHKEYAKAVKVYSRAMKEVDPSIKIGMVTYGYGNNPGTIEEMLAIAGPDIDFFADRGPDEKNLNNKLSVMKKYNKENNSNIRYCNTEWLPYDMFHFNVDSFNWIKGDKSFMFSKWRYALNIFRQIMMWEREGGDILFVNFNNFANTHGQNVLEASKEGAFVSASGRAMGMMARSQAAWILEIEGYAATLLDKFQVQAAYDKKRESLVLYIFNLEDKRMDYSFDISSLDKDFSSMEIDMVYADDLYDMNSLSMPNKIKEMKYIGSLEGPIVSSTIPMYAFAMITLK